MPAPTLFDTHCHLQDKAFAADLDVVLGEAMASGVTHILAPATDLESFDATLNLVSSEANVFGALGIHPHSATEWSPSVRDRIRQECEASDLARALAWPNAKIVAIGEIGLDYHYDFSPRDVQQRAFSDQIALAQELRKPIVVHTRESDDDVFAIITEHYQNLPPDAPRGQFHCFSSTVDRMQGAIELGFYVSFTGNITFKKSTLDDVVRETPLDRLLLETDAPYLTPHPNRGTRNTPAMVGLVARKVAEIKCVELSVITKQTFENALRFFNISIPRSVATILLLLVAATLLLTATSVYAQREQPAGGASPDSVLTAERRRTAEMRKQQEAQLAKEAEQHRLDSTKAAAKEQDEMMAKIREQARQDSIKAAERLTEEQRHADFLLTPMPWKAVGLGFSAGIGDMPMSLGKPSLTPLSVFSYTIDASSAITRRLDVDLSYSHMVVGEPFPGDSVFAIGITGSTNFPYSRAKFVTNDVIRLINSETITIGTYGIDLRYVIAKPDAIVRFYFGLGYSYIHMVSEQHYAIALDSIHSDNSDRVISQTWSRGAIKLLFGMRHDFEIGHGFTLETFAQIAGIGAFQGEEANPNFIFRPDPDQIIMTQVTAGFTMYFGWFGVPREQ